MTEQEQQPQPVRNPEYPDVIEALKRLSMNMDHYRRVLNGTISFLTQKMHEENEQLQNNLES